MKEDQIHIEGAWQNNLKGLDLDLPLGKLIVITGISGSGKSSLAFDTIYAEGQRRYVETFSSYARQFLDRMDKPRVDRIDGIPPAIAIDQTNPVRTSRSTVGTMTELNDHLKLLFARAARLYCRSCGRPVNKDSAPSIYETISRKFSGQNGILIVFPVPVPHNFTQQEVLELLETQGYHRIHERTDDRFLVIQDRVSMDSPDRKRIIEGLETALTHGRGHVSVYPLDSERRPGQALHFSSMRHCADCDIDYAEPTPNLFSFNSPLGACDTCRGFGRIIGVDYNLVIPDSSKTLARGAIKPWQTQSYSECQDDLMRFAARRKIPTNVCWAKMKPEHQQWVLEGEGEWEDNKWYGVKRFFAWLETKAYKMHIRVLLSKYRAYHLCPSCKGARLKPEALSWRIGEGEGKNVYDVMQTPVGQSHEFFEKLTLPPPFDEAADMLLSEIVTRLRYLVDVGLGYLTLDRQSRTLSGGEVQRINLTTALGTSLVNALFVLDEPSIGLHPRDIDRLIQVLHRLRDVGNTLIVVEHDPAVIRAADIVIDMGPGPGAHGGNIVFNGPLSQLLTSKESLTAQYLTGRKTAALPALDPGVKRSRKTSVTHRGRTGGGKTEVRDRVSPKGASLVIRGAAEHNLKDIDVMLPLGGFVCVTGVSGSGKSTLIQDVLYYALRQKFMRPVEQPGRHRDIEGAEHLDDVVLVDQSPIGKTTRSNPVSYVGAFDDIRKLFAGHPLARDRGYTAGTFSFNAGNGRCPACKGSGFEHVEMQFLSDVYLRCPDCDGRRFRSEILDITVEGNSPDESDARVFRSVADVLEMTVDEALLFFSDTPKICSMLQPLREVGLSYMTLGRSLPTLSGGESQRLKLAGYLCRAGRQKNTLFLFDEPTTGLHFDDIATLLVAMRKLIEQGHSVVVIEHNLDVIRTSDWIIDLGPEGGDGGGEVICFGKPAQIMDCSQSHTGKSLREYEHQLREKQTPQVPSMVAEQPAGYEETITIRKAREHNLREIDVTIPRNSFTVITGVSGSGKSTVAFDVLFAEGQRRYLESLNAYARQFVQPASRPDVDGIFGVPPTVAIEQRTSRGGRKSTVATITELYHFLRLLFVKLGVQYCPDCRIPIQPQSEEEILARLLRQYQGKWVVFLAPMVVKRKGIYAELAQWAYQQGYEQLRLDGQLVPTQPWKRPDRYREHSIELPVGSCRIWPDNEKKIIALLEQALSLGKGSVYVVAATSRGNIRAQAKERMFSTAHACPSCGRSFEEPDPRLFSFNSRHGWCPECFGTGLEIAGFDEEQTGEEIWWNDWFEGAERTCPACDGRRLRPEALAVELHGHSITDYTDLSVRQARKHLRTMKWDSREKAISGDIIAELLSRLKFLEEVGLGYLTLDRAAPTLSGGEAQRIRLAAQLGSNLRGVCYVLDEPTIGLHSRDNDMLLDTLESLKKKGNTVVVVEHDEETIRRAEHVLDLGPQGGSGGGRLIAEGTIDDLYRNADSVTGKYLREPLRHPLVPRRDGKPEKSITVRNATLHNLAGIDVSFPLGKIVCVTGVSGSGKSTLVRSILHDNIAARLSGSPRRAGRAAAWIGCTGVESWENVDRIMEVDQRPIGRTPRSCPATYVGIWDEIRKLLARTPEANLRGYSASRFSFNVKGGRCETCDGQGVRKIEMSFLPNVTVPCEVCGGQRFNSETRAVKYRGQTAADILHMNVDEAVEFFEAHPKIHRTLKLLQEVGLGYITLGQQSPTLSGGEAQRIKLVTELARAYGPGGRSRSRSGTDHCLYILDEPTIGLHMADVENLIIVLHHLVDAGNSVVIIEHNMDIIAEADWVIDLGPEGGTEGGRVVAHGTPEQVAKIRKTSHTARFLKRFFKTHGNS
ncbi:MAG: excinuclease ABC subunit UvrA [Chitinispirillaceae bacterium]